MIRFNLACYYAQLGNLTEARSRLQEAVAMDGKYRALALEDADLEPIWGTAVSPSEA